MISNTQLKRLQSLKLKKYRQNYAEFIIEGDKLITEALLEDAPVKMICATKQWIGLHKHAIPPSVITEEVSQKELEKISGLTTPQEAIAVVAYLEEHDSKKKKDKWILVLDNISDPGNLGTIIRTCDWFGITDIYCSENCVEKYNPKVVQSSMGSIFRVGINYGDIEDWLKKSPLKKYAATLGGKNISAEKFDKQGIIVIGSESHGIRKEIISLCDEQITIPKKGNAESLNAAVAVAVILFEVTN